MANQKAPNGEATYDYQRSRDRWRGQVRLQLPTGEHKRFSRYGHGYAKGRARAKAAIEQLNKDNAKAVEDRKNGVVPAPAKQAWTLAGWLNEWAHNWKPKPLKDSAVRARLTNVKRIVDVVGEELPLNDITVHHYWKVLEAMTNRRLSDYSKRQMFVNFSTALKAAERREHLAINFFHKLEERPTPEHEEMRYLSLLEQKQLLAVDNEWAPHWRVLLGTGLRSGELSGLTWGHVDLEEGWLDIQRTYQPTKGGWEFGTPKTKKSRRKVKIKANLLGLLTSIKEHQRVLDAMAKEAGPGDPARYWDNKHGFVFALPTGEPIPLYTVWRGLQATLKEAGIQGRCRVHDLRHTYAANQVNGGSELLELSKALGHATVAFTLDVYGHLWDVSQDSVASRSDEILDQMDRWILQDQAQAAETASARTPTSAG